MKYSELRELHKKQGYKNGYIKRDASGEGLKGNVDEYEAISCRPVMQIVYEVYLKKGYHNEFSR